MTEFLVDNAEIYYGKYVTFPDFNDKTVIASSESAVEAYREAQAHGFDDPVLLYVPRPFECMENIIRRHAA